MVSEIPPKNPLISHYKELFSRPENDSDMFYTKGHKMIQMEEPEKDRKRGGNRGLAQQLMESEAFGPLRELSPSPDQSGRKSEINLRF